MSAANRKIATANGRPVCLVAVAALLLASADAGASEPASTWSSSAITGFTALPLSGAGIGSPTAGSSIEISTSNLPRFDNFDGSNRTQLRIDMALLSPGRSAFGVTMGLSGQSPARYGFQGGSGDALPTANLGLQWRYVLDNNRRIDITAWRDVARPNDALSLVQSREGGYGARVEMQLAGSSSPLVAERGFVGLRLDGGARITLRRSGGKPMVYYRNQF